MVDPASAFQAVAQPAVGRRGGAFILLLALALGGCAASSLALAPDAPDVPYRPEATSAEAERADSSQLPKTVSSHVRDFGLPPLADLPALPPSPSVIDNHVYSLAELIDLAQTNNPQTRIAWEQARQAALAVGMIKATYLPFLSATALGGYQRASGSSQVGNLFSNESNSNLSGTVSTVALQWLLFDFGQRDALTLAAKNVSLASNITFNGTHQKIIYDVSRAFYDYTSARQRTAIAAQSKIESAKLLDAASDRFSHGIGTAVETAQAKQLLAQADFNLVQARGAERDGYHTLLASVGISPTTTMRIEDVSGRTLSPASMSPVERVIADAIARRPDIQASYAAAKAAHAGIAAAEAEFMPKVFVTASGAFLTGDLNVTSVPTLSTPIPGASSAPISTSTSANQTNAAILGGITVPLYDGGVRDARLRDARSKADAADAGVVRLQQGAATEIVAADDALRSSLAAYKAAGVLVQASLVTLDAASSAYKSGAGTLTAAIEAQRALLGARLAQAQAHGTALIAAATLAFMTGHLSSSDVVDRQPF
jgi:outer membrane protein